MNTHSPFSALYLSPASDAGAVGFSAAHLMDAVARVHEPCAVVVGPEGHVGVAFGGALAQTPSPHVYRVRAVLPALWPEHLGSRTFGEAHGCRFPYVVGEMANGIATARMVVAAHAHGLLGFFGAAGLSPTRINEAVDTIEAALHGEPHHDAWGANLIHSPHEPDLEAAVVDLYLQRGVRRVSASAYMDLTPMIVRYAATGLYEDADGIVHRRNFVFAKVSRPEVAARFVNPMPAAMIEGLLNSGQLTSIEAQLARRLPVATDVTVEADSGGHTDNQALPAVFPTVKALVDQAVRTHGYSTAIRVGAAGGLGTPAAVAGAFAMGAAYVLTGSVNQSAVESGLSPAGRALLAQCRLGDVTMAPAADMFEMGVKVQVLKRGTMFANRAHKLYELYRNYASLDAIPDVERVRLHKDILGASVEDMWASTRAFFVERDPAQITRADTDPKHKMALVFRAYLGQASKWAISGDAKRTLDFQIWSGPAMGAFNAWVQGSFLEPIESRTVGQIGLNLMQGAASLCRAQQLRATGAAVPDDAFAFAPRRLALEHQVGTSTAVQVSQRPSPGDHAAEQP